MADRYWVGMTDLWNGTAGLKWSATSGGAGGASLPTAADDVFFDAASGAAITCTLAASRVAKSVNFTGFTGNFSMPGGTTLTLSGSATFSTGMTLTIAGASTAIVFNATATLTSAGKTLPGVVINGAGITVTLADALTVSTINTTTLTAGTLALANFTLSTGIFSSSGSSTRAISFGSGNIALTSTSAGATVLAMTNVTGFSWTGTGGFTRNQVASATLSLGSSTGGVSSRAMNLSVNAGSSTLVITANSYFKNVDFTGSTCTVTASNLNMAGNLTLASGGTYTSLTTTFVASGTITSAGKTLGITTINGSGITVTLAGALTVANINLTQGEFNASNFNVTTGIFSSNNTNTRTLNMGSGTWTILGNGLSSWDTSTTTGLTLVPSTSTITMTNASANIFNGGGLAYYNLNQGGAGTLTISGSNTFNNITNSVQPATVRFTAGTTQTVSNFGLSGTAGNLITINSTTPGSQFTLSDASGTINAQYLSIQDSNATGGAVWNALYSTNLGNNTGWIFASAATGNMFLMFS